jgi:hypothetical protein
LDLLKEYAKDQPKALTDLLINSGKDHFHFWFGKLAGYTEIAAPLLAQELDKSPSNATEIRKDCHFECQARAAIALVRLGHTNEVWPRLQHSPDPRLRSYLVNWLAPLGVTPQEIASELNRIQLVASVIPDEELQLMDAVLFHPETSMRRALILALGRFGLEHLSTCEREPLILQLYHLFCNDSDVGIHGATEWTLRHWGQAASLRSANAEFMMCKDRGNRRWYVNSQCQTLALIKGPVEFLMGSPATELDHFADELFHRRRIPRSYAIATKEVTGDQYQRFQEAHPGDEDLPEYKMKRV